MTGRGALLGLGEVALEGAAGGDRRGPQRDDHQEEDDQARDDEDGVAPQIAPGVRPEAAGPAHGGRRGGRALARRADGVRPLRRPCLAGGQVHGARDTASGDRTLGWERLFRHSGSSGPVRRRGGRRPGCRGGRRGRGPSRSRRPSGCSGAGCPGRAGSRRHGC